jgi:hypothetical protein
MSLNLWILRSFYVAIETFEFWFALKKVVAVRAVFRAAQNGMALQKRTGLWLRLSGQGTRH